MRLSLLCIFFLCPTAFGTPPIPPGARCLMEAYPEHIHGFASGQLIWSDGSRLDFKPIREDIREKERLLAATLAEHFLDIYPKGAEGIPPAPHQNPGKYRHPGFFAKMYGENAAQVSKQLEKIPWPFPPYEVFQITKINGAAARLKQVIAELRQLPPPLHRYLQPMGSFSWRRIAGSPNQSMHSYGIAVDIGRPFVDYWRWHAKGGKPGPYVNRMPFEVIEIFEKHGFIWGGKWYHFDTMHFEYRPEMFLESCK